MEKIFLNDINQILDFEYISNNVGWGNHGDSVVIFTNEKINEWVYFDNNLNEIKKFKFNEVGCIGSHSFGGTTYEYFFYLNKKIINIGWNKFAPTIEKLKLIKIDELNYEIKKIDRMVEQKPVLLNKIKMLEEI